MCTSGGTSRYSDVCYMVVVTFMVRYVYHWLLGGSCYLHGKVCVPQGEPVSTLYYLLGGSCYLHGKVCVPQRGTSKYTVLPAGWYVVVTSMVRCVYLRGEPVSTLYYLLGGSCYLHGKVCVPQRGTSKYTVLPAGW